MHINKAIFFTFVFTQSNYLPVFILCSCFLTLMKSTWRFIVELFANKMSLANPLKWSANWSLAREKYQNWRKTTRNTLVGWMCIETRQISCKQVGLSINALLVPWKLLWLCLACMCKLNVFLNNFTAPRQTLFQAYVYPKWLTNSDQIRHREWPR